MLKYRSSGSTTEKERLKIHRRRDGVQVPDKGATGMGCLGGLASDKRRPTVSVITGGRMERIQVHL